MGRLSAIVLAVSAIMGVNAQAATRVEVIEVPVQRAYVPVHGYDDNDTVEVVLDGVMPNSCYSLGGQWVQKNGTGDQITVRQYAYKRTDDLCADEANLPSSLRAEVPFTSLAWLGKMDAADYQLSWDMGGGKLGHRKFNVEVARSPLVDSSPYAAVSNAYLPSSIQVGSEAQALLTGFLTSTCLTLDSVVVDADEDVYVVLPKVKVLPGVECAQKLVPFETKVSLGKVTQPGRFLMHVRSMNGRAVNTVFTVSAN